MCGGRTGGRLLERERQGGADDNGEGAAFDDDADDSRAGDLVDHDNDVSGPAARTADLEGRS